LSAGAGGDVVQVAAVRNRLFSHGLEQTGLQGQQFLHVFHAHGGMGMAHGLGQSGFGGGHVQLNHFFEAGKGRVGQAVQGFEVGFLAGGDLVNGDHGGSL